MYCPLKLGIGEAVIAGDVVGDAGAGVTAGVETGLATGGMLATRDCCGELNAVGVGTLTEEQATAVKAAATAITARLESVKK